MADKMWGARTPLVTLTFRVSGEGPDQRQATRHWYHVPRVGDFVSVDDIEGEVAEVLWADEGVDVFVHLTLLP